MPTIEGLNSGEGLIHGKNERLVKHSSECSTSGPLSVRPLSLNPGIDMDHLHRHVTIGMLADDVLLEIFKFYVDDRHVNYWDFGHFDNWHTLVHVCRRWRNLVFISPRHLNVQLLCRPKRSVKKMLDIWPELPICIYDYGFRVEVTDNDVAALKLYDRVSQIRLLNFSPITWGKYAPLMQDQFPTLTHLYVQPYTPIKEVISDTFLGEYAPCLQGLLLDSVPFPALPTLLLSTTSLVRLTLWNIPHSGYISPESMAACISALTRLESLSLTFELPRSDPGRASQIPRPPRPHTPTLHPALTDLCLGGAPEYLDDLVAHFDAPLLESIVITLFHREVLGISQLPKFVRRAEKLSAIDQATVVFGSDGVRVSITLPPDSLVETQRVDSNTLMIELACVEWELRLSYLAQVCSLCLPTLSPFQCLKIRVNPRAFPPWQDIEGGFDPQWLELLRHFNIVKELYLSKNVAFAVAQALRELPAERVTEVLPALQTVFLAGLESFGLVQEAMSGFSAARQLSGHHVFIRSWK